MKKLISLILSLLLIFLLCFPAFCEKEEEHSKKTHTEETHSKEEQKEDRPESVENFEAYKETETSITMHWKKVEGAQMYAIYLFDEEANKYKMLAFEEATKFTASSLKAGQTYKFVVKAVAFSGDKMIYSKKSKELKAVTSPKKVGGIKTADIETDSITLSWNKVSGATDYEIWLYNKETEKFSLFSSAEKPTATVNGLEENELYSFKIRARRSDSGAIAYGNFSDIFFDFTNTSSVPRTKSQAAKLFNTKLNALKNEKDVAISYKKTVDTETKSCSKYSLTKTVKNMMNLFLGKISVTYTFKDGQNELKSVNGLVQPFDRESKVTADDILKFSIENEKDLFVLKLVFKTDKIEFNGKTKKESTAKHLSSAAVLPKIKKLKTAPIVIKKAVSTVENAVMTMKIESDSKIKSLKFVCPVEVNADCNVATIDFNTVVGYTMTESYGVKYSEPKEQ